MSSTDPLAILEARREALGWSPADLARAAQMPPPHLSVYRSGRKQMSAATFARLADAMGGVRGVRWGRPRKRQ